MNTIQGLPRHVPARATLIAAAVAALMMSAQSTHAAPVSVQGVVAGTRFTPPSGATPSSTVPSVYQSARVCFDLNDNGMCDAGEPSTYSRSDGSFLLSSATAAPLVAEISTSSTNSGYPVSQRIALRAVAGQVAAATVNPLMPANVAVTPLSTEVARMMEDDGIPFSTARQNLATRLGVTTSQVLSNPAAIADPSAKKAVMTESVILTNRFGLAAKMVDRHDVSPAALQADPAATGPAITLKEAQQAVMNLEGIPRYDHVFIIMLENKATSSIKNSPYAPNMNAYMNAANQFSSYYATGNPSEPNRLAVVAADDFGVADDSAFNCVPNASFMPEELPQPAGLAPCTNATNHNHKNKQNLLTALNASGMSWRIYSESQNPGRDWRLNGAADASLVAPDHVYPAGSPVGAIGDPNLMVKFAGSLYAVKHNSSAFFQNVRSTPEFFNSNRTLGGGQWDEAIKNSPATPAGWEVDQFGKDLISGDVGNFNILEPDQCDDMHGVTLQGTVTGTGVTRTASDCAGNALIYRGDLYTDYLIRKIQASPVWTNRHKRVAIVVMFDEGTATSGFNSCCGWNTSSRSNSLGPIVRNADGTVSIDASIANYNRGNKGHGTSTWFVMNNQPGAPRGVTDSDAYSHFSLVRTMQDMFQLADPGDNWTYMNRSKYTEPFIAANLMYLPEYAGSADPHFDAVRPMNHAYVIPAGYVQKNGYPTMKQIGPDADQRNGWALK